MSHVIVVRQWKKIGIKNFFFFFIIILNLFFSLYLLFSFPLKTYIFISFLVSFFFHFFLFLFNFYQTKYNLMPKKKKIVPNFYLSTNGNLSHTQLFLPLVQKSRCSLRSVWTCYNVAYNNINKCTLIFYLLI